MPRFLKILRDEAEPDGDEEREQPRRWSHRFKSDRRSSRSPHSPAVTPQPGDGITHDASESLLKNSLRDDTHAHLTEPAQTFTYFEKKGRQISLWDQAYESLRDAEPDLVRDYEALLQAVVDASPSEYTATISPPKDSSLGIQAPTYQEPISRRHESLKEIISNGLKRINDQQIKFTIGGQEILLRDEVAAATHLVLGVKSWIDTAVEASPQASIAWAAISLGLPLLTNPSTSHQDNIAGLTYVSSRMSYYVELEVLLQPSSFSSESGLESEFAKLVVDLYQKLLSFQLQSVLRFYRNWFKTLGRDLVQWDDWKGMLEEIQKAESYLERQSQLVNTAAARKGLEQVEKTTRGIHESLSTVVNLARKHLEIAEKQLDALSRLPTKDDAADTDAARVHQLFRLVDYKWYKDSIDERIEGTCQWFLSHQNFENWLEAGSGVLLVSADPGCGKSVLAKHLIDAVLPRSATTCYFFFKDGLQNTLCQALCALIHQLLLQRPSLRKHAVQAHRTDGNGVTNIPSSLWDIIRNAVADPQAGNVVFVLDALDECQETDLIPLVRYITSGSASDGMKFLLTSRPYERVTSAFKFSYLRIPGEDEDESRQISVEINAVIMHRVSTLAEEKGLRNDLKSHIETKLLAAQHRTYLWVHLVFKYLDERNFKKTVRGIDDALVQLSRGVNEVYEQILRRTEDVDGLRRILCIILSAQRPLTVQEMNTASSITSECRTMADIDLEDDEDFRVRLRQLGGLFICISDNRVSLLHQTARDFLLKDLAIHGASFDVEHVWYRSIPLLEAHGILAEICIRYIHLACGGQRNLTTPASSINAFLEGQNKLSEGLFKYAAKFWGEHVRLSESAIAEDAELKGLYEELCDPQKGVSRYYLWAKSGGHDELVNQYKFVGPLIVKATFRHYRALWDACFEQLAVEEFSPEPLCAAVRGGYLELTKALLAANANAQGVDAEGYSVLARLCTVLDTDYWAAVSTSNVLSLMSSMLGRGADLNQRVARNDTPFTILCRSTQRIDVIIWMLEKGADPMLQDEDGLSGLRYLLRVQADGMRPIRRILEDRGFDVNHKMPHGGSLLHDAVQNKYLENAQKLILDGADVNATDFRGRTPLFNTTNLQMGKLLLEHGANVNHVHSDGRPALHYILGRHARDLTEAREALACYLVEEAGATINFRSPLLLFETINLPRLQFLLAKGANANALNDQGETFLHQGSAIRWTWLRSQHESRAEKRHTCACIVEMLRSFGADLSIRNRQGQTILHTIGRNTWLADILVIDEGVDVDARDNDGVTPLMQYASPRFWERAKNPWQRRKHWRPSDAWFPRLLLVYGADIDATDARGRTALHHAALAGNAGYVEYLARQGANTTLGDNDGKVAIDLCEDGPKRATMEVKIRQLTDSLEVATTNTA